MPAEIVLQEGIISRHKRVTETQPDECRTCPEHSENNGTWEMRFRINLISKAKPAMPDLAMTRHPGPHLDKSNDNAR